MLKTIDQATRESKGWSLQELQCHSPLHRENAEDIVDVQEMKRGTWGGGRQSTNENTNAMQYAFLGQGSTQLVSS